jgi:hypothetical protein
MSTASCEVTMPTQVIHRARARSNGRTTVYMAAPAVSVRPQLERDASKKLRAMLAGVARTPSLTPDAMDYLKSGRALGTLATLIHDRPDLLPELVAWLRGVAITEPAGYADVVRAEATADAAEDAAESELLVDPSPANLLRHADLLELVASRSIERARVERSIAGAAC